MQGQSDEHRLGVWKKAAAILPCPHFLLALALLNALDTFVSAAIFGKYGIDLEANPAVYEILVWDDSGTAMVGLKLTFSLILAMLWLRIGHLSPVLGGLVIFAVAIYAKLIVIGGLYAFWSVGCF